MFPAFGGGAGITYLWSTGESTPVITVDSTVTNLWLITSDTTFGCVDTAFTSVTIIDPLLNPIPSPVNSCEGDSITLEVGNFPTVANANILWSTGESTTSIVVSPPVPGEFISVTVSENGIQCIDSVLVLVNPLPQINTLFEDDINGILPNNQPPCTGQVGVQGLGGTPGYTYSWTAGGLFFPATGSTINQEVAIRCSIVSSDLRKLTATLLGTGFELRIGFCLLNVAKLESVLFGVFLV